MTGENTADRYLPETAFSFSGNTSGYLKRHVRFVSHQRYAVRRSSKRQPKWRVVPNFKFTSSSYKVSLDAMMRGVEHDPPFLRRKNRTVRSHTFSRLCSNFLCRHLISEYFHALHRSAVSRNIYEQDADTSSINFAQHLFIYLFSIPIPENAQQKYTRIVKRNTL